MATQQLTCLPLRRRFLGTGLGLVLGLVLGLGPAPASAQGSAGALTLAISEGTSGGTDHARVVVKYGGLAATLERALRRKVNVVFAREFAQLEEGMRDGRFALVFARPSDYPARALRDLGYRYVATARPEGQCLIVVRGDDDARTVAQTQGRKWVMPEQVSYMSRFCSAEMRDRGIDLGREPVKFVREQGAVVFYLQNHFADVGAIASYSGAARQLDQAGLRVLHRSVPQPYFPLIAHARLTPEQVAAMQAELTAVDGSEAGQAMLKRIGIEGFDTGTGPRLAALLAWLGV